ncbi:MAG: ADP-forming succinate--CoA ligase subunit beta [Neisseriaceae bacterium]
MNLHEYQAKALLKRYGLPIQDGILATTPEAAAEAFERLGGATAVIKAQVHTGGRGKAGGVKLAKSKLEAKQIAEQMLGQRLVTYQTDSHGLPIHGVLVCEDMYPVQKELYLGAVIDRSSRRVTFMASTEGGVEIEKVANETPEKIFKLSVDPIVGLQPYAARAIGFRLGLNESQIKQLVHLVLGIYQAFIENDMALIEINPLSIRANGDLVCVDAKIGIDSNALFRHPKLAQSQDKTQENERELKASELGLNYVALEGNIGCMVNGAGLAMATMDIIKLYGGRPANFLDVGGGATKERVIQALKIILEDQSVKAILINIFGGIVRCDMIAQAIIDAVKEVNIQLPIVVRLEGNKAKEGDQLLNNSGLKVIAAKGLADAAEKVIQATQSIKGGRSE